MSLITRCPACSTMFKVVSDQLKVSQGWVRCGQCAEVFDASLHLQPERPPQPHQAAPSIEPGAVTDIPGAAVAIDTSLNSARPGTLEIADPSNVEKVSTALEVTDNTFANAPSGDATAPIPHALQVSVYPSSGGLDEMPANVSFVRDAQRQAFWRRPLVRLLLVLFALFLIALLAMQLFVQQRDKLTDFEPRLKPALQMVCQVLTCNAGPVRQIEAIVIDSSSFNKINDTVYRLSFSIKNTTATAVAMPSLELTLNDTQDQVVIRRVLAPAQLGMASGLLGASAEFSNALTLQLTPLEATSDTGIVARRIAGYRLLAFYP